MVSIYVGEEDITDNVRGWYIKRGNAETLKLVYYSLENKKHEHPLSDCRLLPTRELDEKLLKEPNGLVYKPIESATVYGGRYAVVYHLGNKKPYVYKMENAEFHLMTDIKESSVFEYFADVAATRRDRAADDSQRSMKENISRQLEKLSPCRETALYAYCHGENGEQEPGLGLIFPFGLNESQLTAVEQAFSHQISIVEGPPGTGKTQTILNIIANILLRGKTVAVVSNNNPAVTNIYEKLEKYGLDYLVAKLGSQENKSQFFNNIPPTPAEASFPSSVMTMEEVQSKLVMLKQYLHYRNLLAQLTTEVDELKIERRYLQEWQKERGIEKTNSLDKYGFSHKDVVSLMAYIAYLENNHIRLMDRIELFLKFRILRTKPIAPGGRLSVFHTLQMDYYDKALRAKEAELEECQDLLEEVEFEQLLESLSSASMRFLKQKLTPRENVEVDFNLGDYKKEFNRFLKRFPIIGSSSHSIVNSLAAGTVLDYIIIDEASQQDIVPGVLALGCAKNLIVVGDSRQLPHIPEVQSVKAPSEEYDCERYSLLDSCISVFKDDVPRTLLKEHYRCHPRIIQFCNQQFYNNELIPLTKDNGEASMRLVVTSKGNHRRHYTNLREIDSLMKVFADETSGSNVWLDSEDRGFIAPYRAQVMLSTKHLPKDFIRDTVHKFQGRECGEIVFSTVLDKKPSSQDARQLEFVDAPHMVNVAVSRAKNRFTLVTGDNVFSANNAHIAALVRYIEYYAEDDQIHRAPVISAFDLLYAEYDESLEELKARLRPEDSKYRSEQIIAHELRDILSKPIYRRFRHHSQVMLGQLVSKRVKKLTPEEAEFMGNGASCDFVLYYKVGKRPFAVIEVDSGFHDNQKQIARDAMKDSILQKGGLKLMRLRSHESGLESKISRFILEASADSSENIDTVSSLA